MIALNSLKPLFDDNSIDDPTKEQLDEMYNYFQEDFINQEFFFEGKKIRITSGNSKITNYTDYRETFVHIITREVKKINQRFFEWKRGNRIHWIKPILENKESSKIFFFKWNDGKGVCKMHYWFYEKDFMVVLKELTPDLMIVSAFCVDNDEKLNYYERYTDYKNGKGNC